MNALTTISTDPASKPRTMDNRAYQIIGALKNRLVRDRLGKTSLAEADMPNDTTRAKMEARRAELSSSLSPARGGDIADHVGSVLAVMSAKGGNEADAEAQQRIYAMDLGGLPLFAIAAACADYRRGAVGDKQWAPTPAKLRERALVIAKPFKDELADLEAILDAKPMLAPPRPQTAAERREAIARVRGATAATVDALNPFPPAPKAPDARNSEAERAAAEAQLNAVADRLRSPVRVSEALAERLGAG